MRLIDADNAIHALGVFSDMEHGNKHFLNGINSAKEIINECVTIDAVPVARGEWIEHYDECECPVCGETWNYCDNDTERFDCCPKCGARLVEHGKERER